MTTSAPEAVVPPAAAPLVEEALRSFAKAFRATLLYRANNPMRIRAVEEARVAFGRLWPVLDPLLLHVRDAAFTWGDRVVLQEAERGTDGLPWLLFRDGLRELELTSGFEDGELEALLGLLQRARLATPDEDDLVTLLWVADFACLRYRYVEAADHGVGTPGSAGAGEAVTALAGTRAALGAIAAESALAGHAELTGGPAPAIVRMEDFDGSLYFLGPGEVSAIADELQAEYAASPERDVVGILLDIIEHHGDEAAALEAAGHLDTMLVEALAGGRFALAVSLLDGAAGVLRAAAGLPAGVRDALDGLARRVSEPMAVRQLLDAIDDAGRTPEAALLEPLIAALRPEALAALAAWLGGAPVSPLRERIAAATERLGASHTAALVALLEHEDQVVVRGALPVVTRLASPAAVPTLARLLQGGDPAIRAGCVAALTAIASPGALQVLERAVDDPDRDVRVAALRGVASRRHPGALARLEQGLRRKELRASELGEKMALFEAYGSVCGDAGVPLLDGMLNARTLLGPREPSDIRACAARALGLVGTPAAEAALRRAADAKDPVVRGAVARALRGAG
jgi:hypothetical protein